MASCRHHLRSSCLEPHCNPTEMIRQSPLRTAVAAPSRLLSVSTSAHQPHSFFLASARLVSTSTTTPSTTQASSPPPPSSGAPRASINAAAQAAVSAPLAPKPRQLTYLVERTASRQLAVYEEARSGGTRKETVIRKIVGSNQDLKKDILAELKFKKDDVNINPVTGHIKIKVSPNKDKPQRSSVLASVANLPLSGPSQKQGYSVAHSARAVGR